MICLFAQNYRVGLFNYLNIIENVEFVFSLIILDGAIYWQHRFFHLNKYLWRVHRVHHSDVDLDASSALRFHPIEIILSLFYKIILILIFGFSVDTVLTFEIILNFIAMFNHSNLYIPSRWEKIIRLIIVTPQMHIVHHSIEKCESDSNFGFNLSIWDRVFSSYTKDFRSRKVIGNLRFREKNDNKIWCLLTQPFK